jgi:hypothetical protein
VRGKDWKQLLLKGPRALRRAARLQRAKFQFRRDYHQFTTLSRQSKSPQRFQPSWRDRKPILDERTAFTGFDSAELARSQADSR